MSTPWPPLILNFRQLEDYVCSPTTSALCRALFNVDFHSPDTVEQVQDPTVYTNDDRTPWITTFFGQVKQAVLFQGNHRTFFLHVRDDAPSSLIQLFSEQLSTLQQPVIQDDDDDLGNRRAPLVDRCTDGDRYTGNNARNLEVHTAHCGTRCASVWVGVPPNSTVETPASAASTRLAVGDWVLCQGTLHNRWTPVFDDPRYELLASRVYVLPFEDVDESSSTATLSATETPSQSGPSKRERSTSPIVTTAENLPTVETPLSKRPRREGTVYGAPGRRRSRPTPRAGDD